MRLQLRMRHAATAPTQVFALIDVHSTGVSMQLSFAGGLTISPACIVMISRPESLAYTAVEPSCTKCRLRSWFVAGCSSLQYGGTGWGCIQLFCEVLWLAFLMSTTCVDVHGLLHSIRVAGGFAVFTSMAIFE